MTDGILCILHCSIEQFLIRPEDQWVCESNKAVLGFRIDITQTHRPFTWFRLDYIRSETDASSCLKLDPSHSAQALWDSYPLLGYATSHTFYHLNRSGSPCFITLAKMENTIESTQGLVWVENFACYLFEDITLDSC